MEYGFYEKHLLDDPQLPIIFHYLEITPFPDCSGGIHWHESMEILYVTGGNGRILCGLDMVEVQDGDIVVVNSNDLHYVEPLGQGIQYYYLIPDMSITDDFGLDLRSVQFRHRLRSDEQAVRLYRELILELEGRQLGYKAAAKAAILRMLIYFARNALAEPSVDSEGGESGQIRLVKDTLQYIQREYREPISVDELCAHAGFSKYYFCRTFKRVVGMTVVEYIHLFRCQKAQRLLQTGRYSIAEAAEAAGFHTISYFYRIYKRYMNRLPAQELPMAD